MGAKKGADCKRFPFVNIEALRYLLEGYDVTKAAYILDGFSKGFSVGSNARPHGDYDRNLTSCYANPNVIDKYILTERALGRIIGPFEVSPFRNYQISPIGLIPKSTPGEFRVIQHLSFPFGSSLNDSIPREAVDVQYGSIDDAIHAIMRCEAPAAYMAKTDIQCAYRIIPIRPEERCMMGFKWRNGYYFDCALAMGCSSSSKIFQAFSDSLVWIAQKKFGCSAIVNVLDDFLLVENSLAAGRLALGNFTRMCDIIQVPLKASKTVEPCTEITFLGLKLDSVGKVLILPRDKVSSCQVMIRSMMHKKSIRLRELQSIIGRLNFACLAVPVGRPFLRRLIDLTRGTFKPERYIHISVQAHQDLQAWDRFLGSFNGCSMFKNRYWKEDEVLSMTTDASGSIGFGAILGSAWLHGSWPSQLSDQSIVVKEMVPIVVAVHAWLPVLQGRCVRVVCDNLPVVCAVNSQSCRDRNLLPWIRRFFVVCAVNDIKVVASHISSKANSRADAISRGLFQRLRGLMPGASPHPTTWNWEDFRDLLQ